MTPNACFMIVLVLCSAGCAALSDERAPAGNPAQGTLPDTPLAPFTETIEGTAVSFEMLPVEGGSVTLEIDGVPKTVGIAPYWIAKFETTWEMYDVFVFALDETGDDSGDRTRDATSAEEDAHAVARPSRPYVSPDLGYGHAGYAAISLSYKAARHFCRWLSVKTGRRFRLPTEA